ncbi:Uncharacterised protein [Bordetella pertussis]|nr:Uncharacterised protein [Bordetella pertussis]CFW14566.1 Uncharacterised protein [Bordetella pertussis]
MSTAGPLHASLQEKHRARQTQNRCHRRRSRRYRGRGAHGARRLQCTPVRAGAGLLPPGGRHPSRPQRDEDHAAHRHRGRAQPPGLASGLLVQPRLADRRGAGPHSAGRLRGLALRRHVPDGAPRRLPCPDDRRPAGGPAAVQQAPDARGRGRRRGAPAFRRRLGRGSRDRDRRRRRQFPAARTPAGRRAAQVHRLRGAPRGVPHAAGQRLAAFRHVRQVVVGRSPYDGLLRHRQAR